MIAIKQTTLDNEEIGYIANGYEDENLHDHPFDFTFTQERILNTNTSVGFVPFTRACFENENVMHELNQKYTNTDVERKYEEYQYAEKKLKDKGFRVEGLFDVEIATSASIKRNEREEDQTVELLKQKGLFSASGISRNIGSICVPCPSVTIPQRTQLKNQQDKKDHIAKDKTENLKKKYSIAREVLYDWKQKIFFLIVS